MNTGDKDQTISKLAQAAKSGLLPAAAEDMANQCLKRLESPLRLTVLGTDPVYANRLLNLLVGSQVVAPDAGHVTLQVLHSDRPVAVAIYGDETRKTFKEDEIDAAFANDPVRVRVGFDLPSLKKVSFMRVSADTTADLAQSIRWSVMPSDVVLWCGANFTQADQRIWSALPQRILDHSYLVQPLDGKSDSQAMEGSGFVDLLKIDPALALQARASKDGVDKAAFKSAGATALVRAIKKEIELGERTSLDAAHVILMRHQDKLSGIPPEAPSSPKTPKEQVSNDVEDDTPSAGTKAEETKVDGNPVDNILQMIGDAPKPAPEVTEVDLIDESEFETDEDAIDAVENLYPESNKPDSEKEESSFVESVRIRRPSVRLHSVESQDEPTVEPKKDDPKEDVADDGDHDEEAAPEIDPFVLGALNRVRSRQLNVEKIRRETNSKPRPIPSKPRPKSDKAAPTSEAAPSATPWSLGLEDVGFSNNRRVSQQRPVSKSRTRPVSRLRTPVVSKPPSEPSDGTHAFARVLGGLTMQANAIEGLIATSTNVDNQVIIDKAQLAIEEARNAVESSQSDTAENVQMVMETLDEMDEVLILMSIEDTMDKTDVAKLLRQAAREIEFFLRG